MNDTTEQRAPTVLNVDDTAAGRAAHSWALQRLRRAEEALRQSDERYRLLFERSPCGVYRSTPAGRLLDCNDAFARALGFASRGEALAASAWDLYFDRADREAALDALRRQGSLTNYEGRLRRRDGSEAWVLETVSLVADGAGGEVLEGTLIDLTERKRLEGLCRQSQKMEAVGRLAGGVAHDFNNLLTVINGYGEMLLFTLPADHASRGLVGEMLQAGERAATLAHQLLAFSRKAVPAPEVLDLNAVVAELEKMLRRLISEDVELDCRLRAAPARVRADRGHLEQVLLNLVLNARDAMPRGGALTVETRSDGSDVLLAVADTGVGMSEEVKAHLFEPFFTTKEAGKGTGLGLATVHAIVEQSGGRIEVESEPGRGATFTVRLPGVDPAEPAGRPAGDWDAPRGSEVLLLTEDDASVRLLTQRLLGGLGYTVLEAADGGEALRAAESCAGPIHLLVTDVVMPGLGGRELAERLVAARPGVKVLYISGYTDDEVVRRGVLAGEANFLHKPFTAAALARKVRDVLDAPP